MLKTEGIDKPKKDNTHASVLPKLKLPLSRESKRPNSYHQQFHVNPVQEKSNTYWSHQGMSGYPDKKFPNFKTPNVAETERKSHHILKPTVKSSSEYLEVKQNSQASKNTFPSYSKSRETGRYQSHQDKFYDSSKSSKKVKWEDGYCASPSLEWYTMRPEYKYYYGKGLVPKTRKSYSYNNFLTYNPKHYLDTYKYKDYYNYSYPIYKPPAYSSLKKLYAPEYGSHRNHYPIDYPQVYGDHDNYVYMQKNSRSYSPYFDDYGHYFYNSHVTPVEKSFKTSDTQYDLSDRGHNKKLQVSYSECSKTSTKKTKYENKKVGNDSNTIRFTRSDQTLCQRENASTQIVETRPQSHQTFLVCNSEPKTSENKLNDTAILSRLLLELTDKLKASEHSLSSIKRRHVVSETTQYEDRDVRRSTRHSKMSSSRKKISSSHAKHRRSHVRVMQHESTQCEEAKKNQETENKTSSTLNTDSLAVSEFEKDFFRKDSDRDNFCEIESTRKRRGLPSGVCEERIYAKRLVKKEISPKNTRHCELESGSQGSIEYPPIEREIKKIRHRSYVNTKHCLPFLIDRCYKSKVKHPASEDLIENSTRRSKERRHPQKRRSLSCDVIKKETKQKYKTISNERRGRSANSDKVRRKRTSSKSDFSGPEDDYLEKYVVKLSNPEEKIILYDVKPKFCNYLSNKGVKKKIVERLKSSVRK
ncbi:hypothetical protein HHI36_014062 [Cryptolaemus montrouzieri]|uniref:Uncharacterized protein n=1 Tax=Cryptolaemus montrouzieri TaxID=559131 RepID=A0ABD2N2E1_9CUCU